MGYPIQRHFRNPPHCSAPEGLSRCACAKSCGNPAGYNAWTAAWTQRRCPWLPASRSTARWDGMRAVCWSSRSHPRATGNPPAPLKPTQPPQGQLHLTEAQRHQSFLQLSRLQTSSKDHNPSLRNHTGILEKPLALHILTYFPHFLLCILGSLHPKGHHEPFFLTTTSYTSSCSHRMILKLPPCMEDAHRKVTTISQPCAPLTAGLQWLHIAAHSKRCKNQS